jgi:hypothetical protein
MSEQTAPDGDCKTMANDTRKHSSNFPYLPGGRRAELMGGCTRKAAVRPPLRQRSPHWRPAATCRYSKAVTILVTLVQDLWINLKNMESWSSAIARGGREKHMCLLLAGG